MFVAVYAALSWVVQYRSNYCWPTNSLQHNKLILCAGD